MYTPDLANEKLKDLCNKLGFDCYIFDDPALTDKCLLRYTKTKQEIDAIAVKGNIFLLLDLYSGVKDSEAYDKISKFATGFNDKIGEDIMNNLEIQNSKKGEQRENAEEKLKLVTDRYLKAIKTHDIIIKKVCFYPQVDITEEIEEKYLKNSEIYCIDKEIHNYFLEVNKTLEADYLIREVIGFFSINKKQLDKKSSSGNLDPGLSSPISVTKLELTENKMIMYSSALLAEQLVQYTTVFRIGQKRSDIKGFQRMIEKGRIKKIREDYLIENQTFPNNIIIAFDPEIYKDENDFFDVKKSKIRLYDEYNSLIIIDGQHRFFSFNTPEFLSREILITFIYFKDNKTAYKDMYKMFYKINNKQSKIESSVNFVLSAMINSDSEEAFWFEVFKKLNNTKGLFKNRVSFKEKQLRYKDEKGIVSVIQYGGILSLNRSLKKFDGLYSVYDSTNKKNRINFAFNLMNNYFSIIYNQIISIGKAKDYLTPREIGALLRLLRHFIVDNKKNLIILGKLKNINSVSGDNKTAVDYFKKIISYINFEEIVSMEYSSSNWAAIEGLMFKYIRKKKSTFSNEKILSKKGLEIYKS